MKFKEIKIDTVKIQDSGYKFVGVPEANSELEERCGENRIGNDIDALYEGYDGVYLGEDGKLYSVMFHYDIPEVWCEVSKE